MLRETLGPKDAVMNNGWKAQCKYKGPKDHDAPLLNEGAKKEGHCWNTMCRRNTGCLFTVFGIRQQAIFTQILLTKNCPNEEWWKKTLLRSST